MTKKMAVVGAGGHAKVVVDTASLVGWNKFVLFDDNCQDLDAEFHLPIAGDTGALISSKDEFDGVIVAIGDNKERLAKSLWLNRLGVRISSLIHPSSYVASDVKVGYGTVIFAGSVVQPGAELGKAVIINSGATVDHDCKLENGVHVSPGVNLAGEVKVGESSWVGIGSSVKQGISIGANSIVGAGSVVVTNVPSDTLVFGCPAIARGEAY